jgi:hypothetical protein
VNLLHRLGFSLADSNAIYESSGGKSSPLAIIVIVDVQLIVSGLFSQRRLDFYELFSLNLGNSVHFFMTPLILFLATSLLIPPLVLAHHIPKKLVRHGLWDSKLCPRVIA